MTNSLTRKLKSQFLKAGLFLLVLLFAAGANAQTKVVWKIGEADNQSSGLKLSPGNYKDFLANDFGWEDRFFLIGHSKAENDFPYVLPGPKDTWGGTWSTSGIRSHLLTILFGVERIGQTSWKRAKLILF